MTELTEKLRAVEPMKQEELVMEEVISVGM
jgi:hypothetical protein